MSLAAQIKQTALYLGFDQIGFTKPAALRKGEEALQQWVREGKHGSMKYLEAFESRRERFFRDFPDARSVIVLGVNYYTKPAPVTPSEKITGRVARYAWGKDYHQVIREKHEALIAQLKPLAGVDFKAVSCVDTQPIPERFAAQKAGLGFLGKQTMLLSREFGPWLFLSEIVTNLDLEESAAADGDCGTCDHCQRVCPTGALNQDYEIDARLCISYLTIEHKGVIPRELRPQIKNWIFGCDECLTVCPFTSKSRESRWTELGPESGKGEWLDLDALFEIRSNHEYENHFAGTAMLRAGRKQMLRNACVVLGNSRLPEALSYLIKAMKDPAALVRIHAAWGLGRLGSKEAASALRSFQDRETDPEVLEEIRAALGGNVACQT
jgi:epoxyqueuosine reductase